jgi:hypothetical protein
VRYFPTISSILFTVLKIRTFSDKYVADSQLRKSKILAESSVLYNPMNSDLTPKSKISPSANTTKSGYLVKKGSGKITQVWSRRWFTLRGDYLLYTTRGKDEPPTVASNLRLCMVKPSDAVDRRFCFDVVSPMK